MAHSATASRAYVPLHGRREWEYILGLYYLYYSSTILNTYPDYMITMTYIAPHRILILTQRYPASD